MDPPASELDFLSDEWGTQIMIPKGLSKSFLFKFSKNSTINCFLCHNILKYYKFIIKILEDIENYKENINDL